MAQNPEIQKGVHVDMAVTNFAQPIPAADESDAWVVAVTAEGKLFFGVHLASSEELMEQMKVSPRRRDQNLYIKADARASFADVKPALQAAREAKFDSPVLLTEQRDSAQPGTLVPPKGIEVTVNAPHSSDMILVQLFSSGNGLPKLAVNGQRLPWSDLDSTLQRLVRHSGQIVQVEANDAVSFADVMRVLDQAHGSSATVALPIFRSL
jgi:biopolymer transport protein ExbD